MGILLSRAEADRLLSETPASLELDLPPKSADADAENGGEAASRWVLAFDDALASQRALQSALPAPADGADSWQTCWAAIQQGDSLDLDPDEVASRRRRQEDLRDFQLRIQRKRREGERLAMLSARRAAASPAAADAPKPAADAVSAPRAAAAAEGAASADGAGEPAEGGDAAADTPQPSARSGAAFRPKVSASRRSAAALRRAAQSSLHPLLQLANAKAEDAPADEV